MAGALATTDAEGSDGSEAGVERPAGVGVVEGGTASCGCLAQAASVESSADDKRNEADFICWLSKTLTVLHGRRSHRPTLRSSPTLALAIASGELPLLQ